ncbi:MAG: hypothetical protein ACJ0Q1_07000 [Luminiphilus sp.]
MNKKVLPLAVGAASAVVMSAAHAAMYVNERGTGETLIFPFYSAENGNNTLINIANTTGGHKSVKVRVLEAQNSQEVLDFNLYLSPEDHFSFSISETADGGAMLATGDNSCTVPAIPADGVAFRNLKYATDKADDDADTDADESYDNTSIARTQVGYIEVIEMGQLDSDSPAVIDVAGIADTTVTAINAAAAITHDATGVPANCGILVDAWSTIAGVDGIWLAESKTAPSTGDSEFLASWAGGGLYGYATVINVPQGASFGYDAVAISDHVETGSTGSDMHYQPGDIRPNFTDDAFDDASIVSVNGAAVTLDFAADYDGDAIDRLQALNATIMASEVYNDYVTDSDIAATTDWLMTFPTKAFHVSNGVTEPVEPFSELWTGQSACEPSSLGAVDREESTPPPPPSPGSAGPDFSPAPPTPPGPAPSNNDVPLCYEATIVQFGTETAMGSSTVAVGVNSFLDAANGWATISLLPAALDGTLDLCGTDGDSTTTVDQTDPCDRSIDAGDGELYGLPVVGFAVQKYVNGSANSSGALANYGMATEHKSCAAGSGTVANDC